MNGLWPEQRASSVTERVRDRNRVSADILNSEMKIRAVIERHVEEYGCRNFKNSSLVLSDSSTSSQQLQTNKSKNSKLHNVIFDINKSNIVLLKKQKESFKIFLGKKVKLEDSEDEED